MIGKILFVAIIALSLTENALAVCASLVKGDAAINIISCGRLNPEKTFSVSNERFRFIGDLSPEDRKVFLDTYRGLIVKGLVVRSLAVQSGLSPKKGVLNGETIEAYIFPGQTTCKAIKGKRIKTVIDEACCEGGGDAPCLLNTTYQLKDIKVLGSASGSAGNVKRQKMELSPEYRKANQLLLAKDYEKAEKLYSQLLKNGNLDLKGHYFLGYAYRMMDRCEKAVPILNKVFSASERNDFWANDESIVRKANLLLARCHAKLGRAGDSIIVLQAFLLSPAKYRPEIRDSLRHPDFGRIKTTKEYSEYRALALKAIKR
ncbi:MAG: hypothetical protein HRU19_11435 [Pseudobacteriovorax sp.]|nr:hypothetical protein [Pseudobacteriovorax sp.]